MARILSLLRHHHGSESLFWVQVQMSMVSWFWQDAQVQGESHFALPNQVLIGSFELIICLLGQSVSLHVGKIILPSGLGSEEFRALAQKWEGGREGGMGGSPGEGQGPLMLSHVAAGANFFFPCSQSL